MTPRLALIGAVAGICLTTLGLFLALGPWALVGVGVAFSAASLLLPTAVPPVSPPEQDQ